MSECNKSCKHWPPSSADGKPCSVCDTSNPYLDCYQKKIKGRPKKDDACREQFRLRLNERQRSQLKKLAKKNDISESAMLRKLIEQAFERS